MEKSSTKKCFFEKIEAKNGSFLIKNEENLHPYQKILTSFLIWVMLLFWFHLTDYQEIVIYGMKAVWSFWSFGHLSKSKTDAVKIVTII